MEGARNQRVAVVKNWIMGISVKIIGLRVEL